MSTTAPPQPIPLNQDQADRILDYAITNKMYEAGADGLGGVEPQTRLNDAATLAFQAKRAFDAGNQSPAVMEVLFIAEVEQRPIAGSTPEASTAAPVQPAAPAVAPVPQDPAPPASAEENPYAASSDDQLRQALEVFRASPPNPAIQVEIDRIQATLDQRGASAQAQAPQPAQEVPAPAAPPAPAAAPAPSPAQPAGPSVPPAPAPGPTGEPAAPAVPAPAQAPQPHVAPQHDNLPPVPGRPNPGVVAAGGESAAADAQHQSGAQAPQPSTQGQPPAPQAPAQDAGAALTPAVSSEREGLIAQITGPALKAWGSGRKALTDLTDDQLRMIALNPEGPPAGITKDAVKAGADASLLVPGVEQPSAPPAPDAQPAAPAPQAQPPAIQEQAAPPATPAPVAAASAPQPATRAPSSSSGVAAAMEIISREHLPIPPDIEEEYRLPNDVSKVSDPELRSIHAQAHAVEARVNWLLSELEDQVRDVEIVLADRRRVVKLETPTTVEGKRLTKDQIEARIEADEQVQALTSQVGEIQKTASKLKVIRDNAHRDCERMSRQWSMRYGEERGAPGPKSA